MSEEFKVEIINPESLFFSSEKIIEAVVPAFEGEMGVLKDHISIISFLKPGIMKLKSTTNEENYYIEDGIVEFKDNLLSILTSSVLDLKNADKEIFETNLKEAEKEMQDDLLNDQKRFLLSQKIEVLKLIN